MNKTNVTINPICRTREAPYSYQIIQNLDITGILLFAILTLMTVISVLVFIEETCYMYKKIPASKKTIIIWINSCAPIIATSSCFGMWIPRATMFTDLTSVVCLAVVMHKFQLMLVNECGGSQAFLEKFKDTKLKISTGPFCCCCLCLPYKDINRQTLFVLKLGTFQLAFLRPLSMFLAIVLWANGTFVIGNSSPSKATIWISVSVGVITITALWALGIMFNLVRPHLTFTNIIPKYAAFEFIVILSQLQTSIITILGTTGVISCVPPLPGPSRASYMNQQLLIMEMFLITVICRTLYRRKYDEVDLEMTDQETKDNMQNSTLHLNGKAMEDGPNNV
ncbi:organic solute transporter subunit alpha-like [Bombina bombina]|uniref:organic solute transporter subunit alpha-like n=1 Tax=Bombina bombina TaxID=8345 RepID=UPI00235AB55B|nr:organic solute transporter subunit alpha-like [Bombina bombina]